METIVKQIELNSRVMSELSKVNIEPDKKLIRKLDQAEKITSWEYGQVWRVNFVRKIFELASKNTRNQVEISAYEIRKNREQ